MFFQYITVPKWSYLESITVKKKSIEKKNNRKSKVSIVIKNAEQNIVNGAIK